MDIPYLCSPTHLLNNFFSVCSMVLHLHETSPKIQGDTSSPMMLIWIQGTLTCLMVSAELKAQVFSECIYMKKRKCSMALVSQNLQVPSLQGKVISLTAYVIELHWNYILIPMLNLTRFIVLDKQCLISLCSRSTEYFIRNNKWGPSPSLANFDPRHGFG